MGYRWNRLPKETKIHFKIRKRSWSQKIWSVSFGLNLNWVNGSQVWYGQKSSWNILRPCVRLKEVKVRLLQKIELDKSIQIFCLWSLYLATIQMNDTNLKNWQLRRGFELMTWARSLIGWTHPSLNTNWKPLKVFWIHFYFVLLGKFYLLSG